MYLRSLILSALFAALTAVGSLIKIPVGMLLILTFQTFFMFLAGLMLQPRYAFFSQLVYMAIGLMGLPVFSQGGGLSYVLRPSFGFVLGFLLCATLVSLLVRRHLSALTRDRGGRPVRIVKIAAYSLVSILAMYVFGVAYMYIIYRVYLGDPKTVASLVAGMGVFVLADIAKFAVAIPLAAAVMRRLPSVANSNTKAAPTKRG